MKGGSILQRLRQLSISSSLRGAFLTGALLTLSVSCVSLYSRMSRARRYAIHLMITSRAYIPLF